jgi:hypothetical protein
MTAHAVVLVEGESDRIALETLAARRGRNLADEGVAVVAIGGAQAVGRAVAGYAGLRVGGLYDIGEERAVLRGLERAAVAADGFFACDPDLEGELVRALGPERMLELVESRGQLSAFETYRKQPAQRAKPLEAQLHGWLHNWKIRYAAALIEALELDRVPRPLAGVLAWVGPPRLSR